MAESNDNELRIAIEMGEGYEPTPRLAAAIEELHGALAEIDGDEVQGFAETVHLYQAGFSLGYVSGGSDGGGRFDIAIDKLKHYTEPGPIKF